MGRWSKNPQFCLLRLHKLFMLGWVRGPKLSKTFLRNLWKLPYTFTELHKCFTFCFLKLLTSSKYDVHVIKSSYQKDILQKVLQKILLCILHTVCKIGVGKKIKTFDFPRDVSSCMNDDESSVRSRAHETAVKKYCQSNFI